jgi:hypothetical protein
MSTLRFDVPQSDLPVSVDADAATDPHPDLLELSGWGRQMVRELEAFLSDALATLDISAAEIEKQRAEIIRGQAMKQLRGQATNAEYEPC